MRELGYISIPLRRRDGSVRTLTILDKQDARFMSQRWSMHGEGYAGRIVQRDGVRRTIRLHREIMGLTFGDGNQVDHIDGDPLNNRRSNLRIVTCAQNQQNRRGGYGSSVHRGVSWATREGRWGAKAKLNGVEYWLGYFDLEEDAAMAAVKFRAMHMPYSVAR